MKKIKSVKYFLQNAPRMWYLVIIVVFLLLVLGIMLFYGYVFVDSTKSLSKFYASKSVENFVGILHKVYQENSDFIVDTTYKALRIYKSGGDVVKFLATKTNEFFSRLNYYIINQNGVIVETDYSEDMGLDLSKYENFWEELKRVGKEVRVQKFGFEVIKNRLRIFSYIKEDGGWFELGFLLSDKFINDFRSEILKITNSHFVRGVCLYTREMKPVISIPNQYRSIFSYTTMIGFAVKVFDGYSEKFYLEIDFDFFPLFYFFIVILVLILFGFVSLVYVFRSFSKRVEGDIDRIKTLAIEAYESVVFDKKFKRYDFEIEELEKVSDVLVKCSINTASYLNELRFAKARIEIMNMELKNAYTGFLNKIATIIESFDLVTSLHMYRVFFVTKFILEEVGIKESNIPMFSTFHDIGKIFVKREILTKKGPLTNEEWEEMKEHTTKARLLIDHPLLEEALNICLYHHENFDGSGYPEGLKGEKIPFEARVVKIADVYDALRDERPYKQSFSHEVALEIMKLGDARTKPQHFDPELFKVFVKIEEKIKMLYDLKKFDSNINF